MSPTTATTSWAFATIHKASYLRSPGRFQTRPTTSLLSHSDTTATTSQKCWSPKQLDLLKEFLAHVQNSLQANNNTLSKKEEASSSFVSFVLSGPSKKMLKRVADTDDESQARGCLRSATGRLVSLKKLGVVLQVTFKYHLATDISKNWNLDQVDAGLRILLGLDENNSVTHDDDEASTLVPVSEWGTTNNNQQPLLTIRSATLETTNATYELTDLVNSKRAPRLLTRRTNKSATFSKNGAKLLDNNNNQIIQQHDRAKHVPLLTSAAFLQALGVTSNKGQPRPGMASKLRQCQKFVEIVGALVDKQLHNDWHDKIQVVDMGCGRGYLTFSLHSYLMDKYVSTNNKIIRQVQSRGIDVRPKLVKEINNIAESLGTPFESLHFEQGTIEDFLADALAPAGQHSQQQPTISDDDMDPMATPTNTSSSSNQSSCSLDVLIALHACDTATDDALWSAIAKNTNVIVVAPCCHRQVRPQLDRHYTTTSGNNNNPLVDVLRHNIYRERMAETVTDSLRALLLEIAGYSVQVFEFIGGEHTSKNVMITAVKKKKNTSSSSSSPSLEDLRHRLQTLAAFHGVHEQKLAAFMGESLLDDSVESPDPKKDPRIRPGQMPPLR